MSKNTMPVIFRKFKTGEVIAFFPTTSESYNPNECGSYMHIGQHGVASTELITSLRRCSVEEYTPLLKELTTIYADELYGEPTELVVVKRSHRKYYDERVLIIEGYKSLMNSLKTCKKVYH